MWSNVRCGIEPLEEVAMKIGGGRVQLKDDLELANSANDREERFEEELRLDGGRADRDGGSSEEVAIVLGV